MYPHYVAMALVLNIAEENEIFPTDIWLVDCVRRAQASTCFISQKIKRRATNVTYTILVYTLYNTTTSISNTV